MTRLILVLSLIFFFPAIGNAQNLDRLRSDYLVALAKLNSGTPTAQRRQDSADLMALAEIVFNSDGVELNPQTGSPPSVSGITDPGTPNTGNGSIGSPQLWSERTVTQNWVVTCIDITTPGEEVWSVVGSKSGAQTRNAVTGQPYVSDFHQVGFTISSGVVPFILGDDFDASVVGHTGSVEKKASYRVLMIEKLRKKVDTLP